MINFNDFRKISIYRTYIKNIKWLFNFMKDRIIAHTELEYHIYDNKSLVKDVSQYNNYNECFMDLITEIKNLDLCKTCSRLDSNFCKKCKLNEIIDNLECQEVKEETCPICYKDLTIRYVVICDDNRHKICNECYNKLNANLELLCPICRQHSEDF
jgi:hypothetical protein